MAIGDRIPGLSDKELESFHANAVRLAQSGSTLQRQQAEELLPLLGAEVERRRIERENEQSERRRLQAQQKSAARRPAKPKPA
jgi:hypothetical protein